MSTTEIFVEQLLIGMLALVAGVTIVDYTLLDAYTSPTLALGIVVLGAAYVVGIVYDRIADTLVEDLEQHQRLLTAMTAWERVASQSRYDVATTPPIRDLFPEDVLRVRLFRDSGLSPQGNYFRSRIRLTRAVATLIPALSVGLVFYLIGTKPVDSYRALALVILFGYAIPFILATFTGGSLPRTDDLTNQRRYEQYLRAIRYSRTTHARGLPQLLAILQSRAVVALLIVSAVNSAILASIGQRSLALVPLIGLVATFVAGWTWWRITRSFNLLLLSQDALPFVAVSTAGSAAIRGSRGVYEASAVQTIRARPAPVPPAPASAAARQRAQPAAPAQVRPAGGAQSRAVPSGSAHVHH